MAKPIRYPKKLRMKLERIASDRDHRDAARDGELDPFYNSDGKFDPFRTFLRAFHRPESVAVMHVRVDDARQKLLVRHTMKLHTIDIHAVRPPWLAEPDAPP